MSGITFHSFVRVIKLSENKMLRLSQERLVLHHFVLGFTQRSEDMG